jgi:uncharacterized protein YndB with AHSA1/START domain
MASAQTRTFRLERTFDCTPEELWEAWTTAEEFAQWMDEAKRGFTACFDKLTNLIEERA